MTDITTTAPITFRRLLFPGVKLPKLGIGLALARTLKDYGYAVSLAYVQPYRPGRSQSSVVLEGSEKGRDPSW